PVKKVFYILDDSGKVFLWKGEKSKATELVLDDEGLVEKRFAKNKKGIDKIKALAYSPETGLVFVTQNQSFFMKQQSFTEKTMNDVNYLSEAGNFESLKKLADGTFEITTPDRVKKKFNNKGQITIIERPFGRNTHFYYNS